MASQWISRVLASQVETDEPRATNWPRRDQPNPTDAAENRLWGAERIRGELLKLGIRVAKQTVQKHMRQARPPAHQDGQTWRTFLRNHSVWACDFLQTYDIWFRPIFAFFIVDINTKRVVHIAATRAPTATWTAQMNATCERFLGTVRRECLDHVILLGVRHFERVLKEYCAFFNSARPHQGLAQLVPTGSARASSRGTERIVVLPVLGGLHHDYRAAA